MSRKDLLVYDDVSAMSA